MRYVWLMLVLLVAGSLMLVGPIPLLTSAVQAYRAAFLTDELRYRLTLRAEVDGQPVEGSGVIQVMYVRNIRFLGDNSLMSAGARGEAVILDLDKRGYVFALMTKNDDRNDQSDPRMVLPVAFGLARAGIGPEHLPALRSLSGSRELPYNLLPLLVRFKDINDPRSVERVDPNDLAASFGPSVRLVGVTIEVVDNRVPITMGIEKLLAWLPEYYDRRLDGQRYETIDAPNRTANSLASGSFKANIQ